MFDKLREKIQKSPIWIVAPLAVLLIGAAVYFFAGGSPAVDAPAPFKIFMVDEETGAESVGLTSEPPPLKNASGKETIVQGIYYACGPDDKDRKLVYLQKYTPEAREIYMKLRQKPSLANGNPDLTNRLSEGTLVRKPGPDQQWVPLNSSEAATLDRAFSCPPGKILRIAKP